MTVLAALVYRTLNGEIDVSKEEGFSGPKSKTHNFDGRDVSEFGSFGRELALQPTVMGLFPPR